MAFSSTWKVDVGRGPWRDAAATFSGGSGGFLISIWNFRTIEMTVIIDEAIFADAMSFSQSKILPNERCTKRARGREIGWRATFRGSGLVQHPLTADKR